MVAGGSETQHIKCAGIGRKQMGQSSFGGGSLNSVCRVARRLVFYSLLCASANASFGTRRCNTWLAYTTCTP